jgi:hypothetical protein
MTQRGQRLRFTGESFRKARNLGNLGRKNFEGHQAVQAALPRLVNGTHAAAPQQALYFELREQTSEGVWVRR